MVEKVGTVKQKYAKMHGKDEKTIGILKFLLKIDRLTLTKFNKTFFTLYQEMFFHHSFIFNPDAVFGEAVFCAIF